MSETVKRLVYKLTTSKLSDDQLRDLAFAGRLRRLFDEHRIDTVLDVGANTGQFRDFLRRKVGFKGQIESFEPVPDLAAHLMTRAESDTHWKIHTCALGPETGQKTINVMAKTEFNSFLNPVTTGSHQDQMNKVKKTVTVPITTLDTVFNKRDLSRTYLKLDTQGYDLEVLKGGQRAIKDVPALQTEISIHPFCADMPTFSDTISAFERHGFAMADLYLVSSDDAKRAMEFDCLMVRVDRNLAALPRVA